MCGFVYACASVCGYVWAGGCWRGCWPAHSSDVGYSGLPQTPPYCVSCFYDAQRTLSSGALATREDANRQSLPAAKIRGTYESLEAKCASSEVFKNDTEVCSVVRISMAFFSRIIFYFLSSHLCVFACYYFVCHVSCFRIRLFLPIHKSLSSISPTSRHVSTFS